MLCLSLHKTLTRRRNLFHITKEYDKIRPQGSLGSLWHMAWLFFLGCKNFLSPASFSSRAMTFHLRSTQQDKLNHGSRETKRSLINLGPTRLFIHLLPIYCFTILSYCRVTGCYRGSTCILAVSSDNIERKCRPHDCIILVSPVVKPQLCLGKKTLKERTFLGSS